MHLNCRLMFEKYAKSCFTPGLRVLEVGPDLHPSSFQQFVGDSSLTWHTIDIFDDARLTYRATSEYTFPIPDAQYDIVLAANVLEHVRKVWVWMKELTRVCKSGGRVITINPVSWPFHEAPIDCWRAYPEGIKALCDEANLDVELCLFETMEMPGYRRYIPGASIDFQGQRRKKFNRIFGHLGIPVEVAYDTITIARKP